MKYMPASAPLMPQATACCCQALLGQALGSRCAALRSRPAPAARPHRQAAWAAQAGGREGGGAGGGGRVRPWRLESVTFLAPDHASPGRTKPMRFLHLSQRDLDSILKLLGALGFELADGGCTRRLEYLPEGGTVRLVMPFEPSHTEQVRPTGCPAPFIHRWLTPRCM